MRSLSRGGAEEPDDGRDRYDAGLTMTSHVHACPTRDATPANPSPVGRGRGRGRGRKTLRVAVRGSLAAVRDRRAASGEPGFPIPATETRRLRGVSAAHLIFILIGQ